MDKPNYQTEIITPKLYITEVSDDRKLLKISGQIDKETAVLVERLIASNQEKFDQGYGLSLNQLKTDLRDTIFVAKYTDGMYYRARAVSGSIAENGTIKLLFVDYGNTDEISIKNIRLLPSSNPICQLPPTSSNFYLAGILSNSNAWHPEQLKILNKLLNYQEYNIISQSKNYPLISIEYANTDLTTYLLRNGFGIHFPIIKQEVMLLSFLQARPQPKTLQDLDNNSMISDNKSMATNMTRRVFTKLPHAAPPSFCKPTTVIKTRPTLEYKQRPPFLSHIPPPFGDFSIPPPFRNSIRPQPPVSVLPPFSNLQPQHPACEINTTKHQMTFAYRKLNIDSIHNVLVSHINDGPGNFSVQLQSNIMQLQSMVDEINKFKHPNFRNCPTIGEVCLGRSANKNMISRAVISTVSSQGCHLNFVDYGHDEFVHYSDIFQIPQEFILQPAFAIKICLSGIQNVKWNHNMDISFRNLVTDRLLTLRVMPSEGAHFVQYGELYYNKCNILNFIRIAENESNLEYLDSPTLSPGFKELVLVSYVDSCVKFYVQLLFNLNPLNAVMDLVHEHCEQSSSPGELAVGSPCCAKFLDDGRWYRAKVLRANGEKVMVAYVDYGNEQEIHVSDIRSITKKIIKLPIQAIRCALKDLENRSDDTETSNLFEKLTLEKEHMIHVVGRYSSDTLLVSLYDETTNPSVDVSKRLLELKSPKTINKNEPVVNNHDRGKKEFNERSYEENRQGNSGKFSEQRNVERPPKNHYVVKENNVSNRSASRNRSTRSTDNDAEDKQKNESRRNNDRRERRREGSRDKKFHQSNDSLHKPERKPREVVDPADDDAEFGSQQVEEGAVLNVTVTWLTSPTDFYVMPLSLRAELEDMMRQLPDRYRGVRPGAGRARAVVARYPADRALYRAAVLERRPPARLLVRYVDFGNKALVADTDVWRLGRDLLGLPRLAIPCALAGLRAKSGADPKRMDACFSAERYSCRVGPLLEDGRRSVTLTAPDGRDAAAALLEAGVAEPETPREPFGEPHYVAHVDSPGQFWLHSFADAERLERLQAELAARADSFPPLDGPAPGSLGCARYSADERWYRAEVLDADADITTVRFVDYGNTDVLGPDALRRLPAELASAARLARRCRLHAAPGGTGEWSEAAADRFAELLLAAPSVDARVVLAGDPSCVELRADGADPAATLVAEGLAAGADRTLCVQPCFASHVGAPDEFWVQLESAAGALADVEDAMAAAASWPPVRAEEGALVAAQYAEDGGWYRARVCADGSAGAELLFVDYGNASLAGEMRALPPELAARPALARKCALRPVRRWGRRASARFEELAAEGATVFGLSIVASGDLSVVDLLLDDRSVADMLLAIEREDEEAARGHARTKGHVCYVHATDEFYVQYDDVTDQLDTMVTELDGCDNFEVESELKVGGLCAAFSSEYEQWYRAKIIELCDVGAHVQFVDYGNKSNCEEFRRLPENLAQVKPLASCYRLAGIDDPNNETYKTKFQNIILDDPSFEVEIMNEEMEPKLVKLYLNGEDVTNLITHSSENPEPDVKPTDTVQDEAAAKEENTDVREEVAFESAIKKETAEVMQEEVAQTDKRQDTLQTEDGQSGVQTDSVTEPDLGSRARGHVCYVHTTDEFYVQFDDITDVLDSMVNELDGCENFEIESELNIGTLCATFSSEYEQWYRAKIIEFCDVGALVQFVDYGNKSNCEEFRRLPDNLSKVEPLATCYRLAGIDDPNNETYTAKFQNIILDDPSFEVEIVDEEIVPNLVKLYLNDEDVANLIIHSSENPNPNGKIVDTVLDEDAANEENIDDARDELSIKVRTDATHDESASKVNTENTECDVTFEREIAETAQIEVATEENKTEMAQDELVTTGKTSDKPRDKTAAKKENTDMAENEILTERQTVVIVQDEAAVKRENEDAARDEFASKRKIGDTAQNEATAKEQNADMASDKSLNKEETEDIARHETVLKQEITARDESLTEEETADTVQNESIFKRATVNTTQNESSTENDTADYRQDDIATEMVNENAAVIDSSTKDKTETVRDEAAAKDEYVDVARGEAAAKEEIVYTAQDKFATEKESADMERDVAAAKEKITDVAQDESVTNRKIAVTNREDATDQIAAEEENAKTAQDETTAKENADATPDKLSTKEDTARDVATLKDENLKVFRDEDAAREEIAYVTRDDYATKGETADMVQNESVCKRETVDNTQNESETEDDIADRGRDDNVTKIEMWMYGWMAVDVCLINEETADTGRDEATVKEEVADVSEDSSRTTDETTDMGRDDIVTKMKYADTARDEFRTKEETADTARDEAAVKEEILDAARDESLTKGETDDTAVKEEILDAARDESLTKGETDDTAGKEEISDAARDESLTKGETDDTAVKGKILDAARDESLSKGETAVTDVDKTTVKEDIVDAARGESVTKGETDDTSVKEKTSDSTRDEFSTKKETNDTAVENALVKEDIEDATRDVSLTKGKTIDTSVDNAAFKVENADAARDESSTKGKSQGTTQDESATKEATADKGQDEAATTMQNENVTVDNCSTKEETAVTTQNKSVSKVKIANMADDESATKSETTDTAQDEAAVKEEVTGVSKQN